MKKDWPFSDKQNCYILTNSYFYLPAVELLKSEKLEVIHKNLLLSIWPPDVACFFNTIYTKIFLSIMYSCQSDFYFENLNTSIIILFSLLRYFYISAQCQISNFGNTSLISNRLRLKKEQFLHPIIINLQNKTKSGEQTKL